MGALWENYLIGERKKKNLNENADKDFYFWRTYDSQEIDLIETSGDEISAFEIKWGNKTPKIPRAFALNYPNARYNVVNQNNYLDFVL